jgi:RimJ/RimL family protein N-acetyltransferase
MKCLDSFITKLGKEITFRYPTIDDVKILKDYINKISAEQSFLILQGFQNTIESETKWLQDKLDKINKNKCVYLCGFYNDNLVTCSEITLLSDAKAHVGNFGISVAIDFRGQGIGQKIMELTIKESVEKISDLKIIDLEVFGQNKIAINLYNKLGFIKYGMLPKALKRKGKYDDAILMYKRVK